MLGIIGLILAIACMIFFAYKGLGALPLTLMCALIVALFNGMNVWEAFSKFYMGGYTGVYMSYFLIFVFSAFYAKLMDESGSATAIGYKLIDWFGKKNVMLVSILMVSALTYGGISLFVVIFAVAPILFMLFKEAHLPRHLTITPVAIGAATYTMTSLPGTPQLTNVIPTQFLGTTMTAAPILGILCSIGLFILCYIYARYAENKARKKGEDFTFPVGIDPARYEVKDRAELPAAWKAFLPMIVLVAIIIVGGIWIKDAPMLTVIAMIIAAILTYVLNYDKLKSISIKQLLNKGLGDGITAIGGLAGVVAFGAVVSNSAAFQDVVKWVLNVNMNPYWKGVFAVAIIAGITGSSSGGLRIMYTNMAEYFKGLAGINLSTLHRLTSVAAGSLDSLPHSSGIFLMLSYLGLSHKEGYKHMFWTTVVIPAIVVVVATLIITLFGIGAPAVPVVTPVV